MVLPLIMKRIKIVEISVTIDLQPRVPLEKIINHVIPELKILKTKRIRHDGKAMNGLESPVFARREIVVHQQVNGEGPNFFHYSIYEYSTRRKTLGVEIGRVEYNSRSLRE